MNLAWISIAALVLAVASVGTVGFFTVACYDLTGAPVNNAVFNVLVVE